VVTEPNGTVAVSIHDLRDPLGLQHALRAHGVAAIVRFHRVSSLMPGCFILPPSTPSTVRIGPS
jgi:hypothetical protein